MKRALLISGLFVALGVGGCAHEEQPHRQTPAQIQAEIEKVRTDPQMPSNIKAMVIGQLQGSLAKTHTIGSGS